MDENKTEIAKVLTIMVMGEDYREPNNKPTPRIKTFWWRVKKCLFGL